MFNSAGRSLKQFGNQLRNFSKQTANTVSENSKARKAIIASSAAGIIAGCALWGAYVFPEMNESLEVAADDNAAHPPHYPWNHIGIFESYDAASIRRGYQVYREICSACHGMDGLAFRNLNIAFNEAEIKNLAAEVDVEDGPNEKGKMFKRPAKAFDYILGPYPNEQAARAANGGALPPELSTIAKARARKEDYIFSLLTGYDEPPAGVKLRDGLYFNAYFPGGAIGMAPPLADGAIEFPDGTPATVSQMAKDVAVFLAYSSRPDEEDRKKFGVKVLVGLAALTFLTYSYKRFRWNQLKSRRMHFGPK